MSKRCPSCGFGGAAILTDGSRQCVSCGHRYSTPVEYPPLPGHRKDGKGDDGDFRFAIKFFVGLAIFLIISGFVASFFLYGEGGPYDEDADRHGTGAARTAESTPETADTRLPRPETLAADVGFTGASGRNGEYSWWVVMYRNTGTKSISQPKVRLSIKNDAGTTVATDIAYAYAWELPPGAEVAVLIQMKNAPEGRAEFSAHEVNSSGFYADRAARLTVTEFGITERSGSLSRFAYLDGKLQNNNPKTAKLIRLVAVGRDDSGNVVSYANGSAKEGSIRVEGRSDFRITVGTWMTERPTKWEITAWCVLEK